MRTYARYLKPTTGVRRVRRTIQFYLSFSLILVIGLPLILSEYEYSYYQVLLATLLIAICVYPTVRYFAHQETGIPTMAIFCLAYALQFGLPIFTRDPTIELMGSEVRYIDDSDVIAALLMAIVGVVMLQLGYFRFRG